MILAQSELRDEVERGGIRFDPPLEERQWGEASVDLRLGLQFTKLKPAPGTTFSMSKGIGVIAQTGLLDYSNQFFIVTFETGETQLPVSLKPKLAFFKKHFDLIPGLTPYRERALVIVDSANKLKETRHDVIHGIADKKTTLGNRRFVRVDYKGKALIRKPRDYSIDQINEKTLQIARLADSLSDLLAELIEIDFSKQ